METTDGLLSFNKLHVWATNTAGKCPDVSLIESSSLTLTNVETPSWTVVTGLQAVRLHVYYSWGSWTRWSQMFQSCEWDCCVSVHVTVLSLFLCLSPPWSPSPAACVCVCVCVCVCSPCVSPVCCQLVFLSLCFLSAVFPAASSLPDLFAFATRARTCFLVKTQCRVVHLSPNYCCGFPGCGSEASSVMMAAEVLNCKHGVSDGFAGRNFGEICDPLTLCSESTVLSNDLSIKLLGCEVTNDEATHCWPTRTTTSDATCISFYI